MSGKLDYQYNEDPIFFESSEENKNSLKDQLVAMSRALARCQIKWSLDQKKLFFMCLTRIRFKETGNDCVIVLDNREIVDALGLSGTSVDSKHRNAYLRKIITGMSKNSYVELGDPNDAETYKAGALVSTVTSKKGKKTITINKDFMPELEDLLNHTPFLTYYTDDIYAFKSRFAFALFNELRSLYDTRALTNYRTFTTKQLKDLFELSKADYVRRDGSFDRSNFEKYTIDVAVAEINQSEMMTILPHGKKRNGLHAFYEKKKKNGHVSGYEFKYIVRPRRATGEVVSVQEKGQVANQMSIFDY